MSKDLDFNKIGDNEEKRIFKIEVGQIAPEDVEESINKIREAFNRPISMDFKLPTEDEK